MSKMRSKRAVRPPHGSRAQAGCPAVASRQGHAGEGAQGVPFSDPERLHVSQLESRERWFK